MTYDCRECGACCLSDSDTYVELDDADVAALQPHTDLVHRVGDSAYLRMARGHCAALVRDAHGLSCSVYGQRPRACRDLAAGSPACLEERALKRRSARRLLSHSDDASE